MSVDKICTRNVVTISRDADIAEAALKMRQAHVGDLVVTEYRNGRETPIGMVTDRDIVVEVVAQRVQPESLKVADIMSGDVLTVHKDNGIAFAVAEMHKAGVRRVPVVEHGDALVGVLSLDDVVQHLAATLVHVGETLQAEQSKEARLRP